MARPTGGRERGRSVKYRKKPVVIESVRWSGLIIKTLEGEHVATIGDYIIRGVKGEFYPCKPDIFEATYEPVEAGKGE